MKVAPPHEKAAQFFDRSFQRNLSEYIVL